MSSLSLDCSGASGLVSPRDPATRESPRKAEKEPAWPKRRVSTACDLCRSKKVKCDGIQPICGPCAKQAADRGECSWRHAMVRAQHRASRDDIDRQFKLHQQQKDTTRTTEPRHGADTTSAADTDPIDFDQPSEGWRLDSRRPAPPVGSGNATPRGCSLPSRAWNGSLEIVSSSGCNGDAGKSERGGGGGTEQINAMIGYVSDRDQDLGLFGSSSIGSFMTTVRRAVHHTTGPSLQNQDFPGNDAPAAASERNSMVPRVNTPKEHGDAYLLPQRTRADTLISIYWDILYSIYPIISQSTFAARYADLWNGQRNGCDDSEFLCLLNAIFAVATILDHKIAIRERKPAARAFFRRTQDLLVLWSPASLLRVQSFLVLAQYLQSTNESHQCWMFIGYAVRTAESLGLHLPATTERMADIVQREECRRVWYGCIHMDRILAMVYGRPTVVKQAVATSAPRPLSLDEENFVATRSSDSQPDSGVAAVDEPQIVDFFVQSLDLFDILSETLEEFYELRPVKRSSTALDEHEFYFGAGLHSGKSLSVLEIDQKLCRWERSLLPHLREYRAGPDIYTRKDCPSRQVVLVRQAVVLRQRFLHIRLLSLRPILASLISFEAENSHGPSYQSLADCLPRRLALQCSVVCCQVAQEAIDLVHSSLPPTWSAPSVTATWWYNVFYVYSAATVLVAAKLAPSIVSDLGEASLARSWQQATNILQAYSPFSDSIPKLVAALQVLDDEVPVRYLRHMQRMTSGGLHAFPPTSFNFATNARSQGVEALSAATQFNFTKDGDTDESRAQTGSQFQQQQQQPPPSTDPLDSFASGIMLDDFEGMAFDPGDLSWLNTIPFSF